MHITTTPFYDIPKQTSNMPWKKGHFNHFFLVAKFTQYTCSSLHIKVIYRCKVCYSSSSNQKVWKYQKAIMSIYDSTIPKSVKIRIFWNWVNLKDTNGFNHCFWLIWGLCCHISSLWPFGAFTLFDWRNYCSILCIYIQPWYEERNMCIE